MKLLLYIFICFIAFSANGKQQGVDYMIYNDENKNYDISHIPPQKLFETSNDKITLGISKSNIWIKIKPKVSGFLQLDSYFLKEVVFLDEHFDIIKKDGYTKPYYEKEISSILPVLEVEANKTYTIFISTELPLNFNVQILDRSQLSLSSYGISLDVWILLFSLTIPLSITLIIAIFNQKRILYFLSIYYSCALILCIFGSGVAQIVFPFLPYENISIAVTLLAVSFLMMNREFIQLERFRFVGKINDLMILLTLGAFVISLFTSQYYSTIIHHTLPQLFSLISYVALLFFFNRGGALFKSFMLGWFFVIASNFLFVLKDMDLIRWFWVGQNTVLIGLLIEMIIITIGISLYFRKKILEIESINRIQNLSLSKVLSQRELEVVEQIIYGYKNKEIGEHLFISENTVKKHIASIYKKSGVNNRSQLVKLASLQPSEKK